MSVSHFRLFSCPKFLHGIVPRVSQVSPSDLRLHRHVPHNLHRFLVQSLQISHQAAHHYQRTRRNLPVCFRLLLPVVVRRCQQRQLVSLLFNLAIHRANGLLVNQAISRHSLPRFQVSSGILGLAHKITNLCHEQILRFFVVKPQPNLQPPLLCRHLFRASQV